MERPSQKKHSEWATGWADDSPIKRSGNSGWTERDQTKTDGDGNAGMLLNASMCELSWMLENWCQMSNDDLYHLQAWL